MESEGLGQPVQRAITPLPRRRAEDDGRGCGDDEDLLPIVREAIDEDLRSSLQVAHVAKNAALTSHFRGHNLRDFFDDGGRRRYRNLSLSFAAKQHPQVQTTFGSMGWQESP